MKRIIIDMDDVLVDTLQFMVDRFNRENPSETISFDTCDFNTFTSLFNERMKPYLFEKGFFLHLPFKIDAQEVVKKLYEKYEVFIVSSAVEFPLSLIEKYQWLEKHFPFIHWKQIVFCGDKRITHGDIMIDDLSKNLEPFEGQKLLFSCFHNLHETRFTRVHSWKEIAKILL